MQVNKIQTSTSFKRFASINSKTGTNPSEELGSAIADFAVKKGVKEAAKCLAVAAKIDGSKLYSVEFERQSGKNKGYIVRATSVTGEGSDKTINTGIFYNRNLLGLLKNVNKFIERETKKIQKNSDFLNLSSLDSVGENYVEDLRKALN